MKSTVIDKIAANLIDRVRPYSEKEVEMEVKTTPAQDWVPFLISQLLLLTVIYLTFDCSLPALYRILVLLGITTNMWWPSFSQIGGGGFTLVYSMIYLLLTLSAMKARWSLVQVLLVEILFFLVAISLSVFLILIDLTPSLCFG
jgi:hypothetical protein